MNFYIYTILAVFVAQSTGFKIGQKTPLKDLSVPILTEYAPGQFRVKLGEREPRILSTHEADCGLISYPSNGEYYENNEDVVILVNPQTPGPREISFTLFDTEIGFDYVSIFTWQNNQFVLDTRTSGKLGPLNSIVAPEGRFLIAFTSDVSVTSRGFTLAYYKPTPVQEKDTSDITHKIALENVQSPVLQETEKGLQVQIGDRQVPVVQLTADCGSFGSFSYPSNGGSYENNEDAAFLIIPEAGEALEIAFTRFDLERSFDFVSVHVWENNQFRLVGRYSDEGSRPSPIVAPHGRTLITFTSDSSVTRTGFQVVWYARN